jgi:hypothetical protein
MINIDPSNIELSKITQTIQKQDISAELINIDLTTLNSLFGYDTTNFYKQSIIDYIQTNLKENILFSKILGGKILLLTKIKLTSNQKQNIQDECAKILGDKGKYLYITEKTIYQNSLQTKELLEKYISVEIYLNTKRGNIQKYLNQSLNSNQIFGLSETWEKSIQESKKIQVKLDKSNYKEIIRLVKNSIYLTHAVYAYSKNNFKLATEKTLEYKIWYELQEILFNSHKIEKINTHIEVVKDKDNKIINRKFKLEDEFILDWFNSTIKSLYPFFNQKQLDNAKKLEEELTYIHTLENEKDIKNKIDKILNKITQFTDSLDIKGFQSILLQNLIQSKTAVEFIQRQIYLNFKPEKKDWNNYTQKYLSQDFIKPEYRGFTKGDSDSLLKSSQYLNQNLIQKSNIQYLTSGFLEIDFFNAFNSYFFPTDSDKFYNEIVDSIFEEANKVFLKNSQLFKTLNIGIMGDEFFFLFLTSEKIDKKQLKIIKEFLLDINNLILDKTEKRLIIQTKKKIIISKTKKEIIIRVPLEKRNIYRTPEFQIGKISLSKYLLINTPVQFQKDSKEHFKNIYKRLDYKMKEIKKEGLKELVIEENDTLRYTQQKII